MTRKNIHTKRLCLRSLRNTDAARLADLANRREIATMLASMPHPYTQDHARTFIAEAKAEKHGAVFAITLADRPDELIGVIGYGAPRVAGKPENEIDFGYWLGVDYWGRGYASEAGEAVVRHAFDEGGVGVIDTDYLVENPASGRVLSKLGFEDLGERTCYSCARGAAGRSRHMRLTREAHDFAKSERVQPT